MKLKSFRIKNYKSIKDSGVCYLSGDNITILAGKNESGKTAILEALEDFNILKNISEKAIPINRKEALPEILMTFTFDKNSLQEICNNLGLNYKNNNNNDLEIIKGYPNKYYLSEDSKKQFNINDESILNQKRQDLTTNISNIYSEINNMHTSHPEIGETLPELNFKDISNFRSQLETFNNSIQQNLQNIPDEPLKNNFNNKIIEITELINNILTLKSIEEKFLNRIKEIIPNFILFNSFDDIFPSKISLVEAPNNELMKDLALISDLDFSLITSGPDTQKFRHKVQLNKTLSEEYKKFWTQDLTNLYVDWDSEKLFFYIEENEYYYPPDMRSKGKQWHLAFYVRVSARAKEDTVNIILIDEPGLFLHATAQEDVLKKLEDSANSSQIIFSTHSPYLIEINKLSRIRLVLKDNNKGTAISNKIHKDADKETLTPIITAIGLDLSKGLDIAKDNNIIIEGISDYYFLLAFINLLKFKFKKPTHFIPSIGADKINFLVSLMIGWELNYCVLLDRDKKGKDIEKKLNKVDSKILYVSKNNNEKIEDLFTRDDFIIHVLNEDASNIPEDKKNSMLKKEHDNVLLSKLFMEKIGDIEDKLSKETISNFKNLLTEINNFLFSI